MHWIFPSILCATHLFLCLLYSCDCTLGGSITPVTPFSLCSIALMLHFFLWRSLFLLSKIFHEFALAGSAFPAKIMCCHASSTWDSISNSCPEYDFTIVVFAPVQTCQTKLYINEQRWQCGPRTIWLPDCYPIRVYCTYPLQKCKRFRWSMSKDHANIEIAILAFTDGGSH